jgi:hypothetical protein
MNKVILIIALLTSPLIADTIEVIGPSEVVSKNSKRLDDEDTLRRWEFKFSEKGSWKIACRPDGPLTWPFWCNLDYTGYKNGYKSFESKRMDAFCRLTTIRLFIRPDGRAQLSEQRSDDVIYYYFNKPNSFLEEAYDKN